MLVASKPPAVVLLVAEVYGTTPKISQLDLRLHSLKVGLFKMTCFQLQTFTLKANILFKFNSCLVVSECVQACHYLL